MALIKCPECNNEISNKSLACIHCGFPLSEKAIIDSDVTAVNNTSETINVEATIHLLYEKTNFFMNNLQLYNQKTMMFIPEIQPELLKLKKKAENMGGRALYSYLIRLQS